MNAPVDHTPLSAMLAYTCPCCASPHLDADDMDLEGGCKHSRAVRERYGAPVCKTCTDEHHMSQDRVLLAPGEGVEDCDGDWWSDEAALAEAEDNAAADYADRRMMGGWR